MFHALRFTCWLPMRRTSSLLLLAALLAACARPPVPLGGEFEEITVADAQQQDLTGRRVRWGGTIAEVTTSEKETCFQVVSRPLDRQARPLRTDETAGRFLACASGFYDPAIYDRARELTVVGTLQGTVAGKIGEFDYRFPKVACEQAHLWPRRPRAPRYEYYPYYWYWYPYWYPWGYYPYWHPGPYW